MDHNIAWSETRTKPRSTHSHGFGNGTLDKKCLAVLEDLDYTIPELDTGFFVNTFLPPASSLKGEGLINSDGKWDKFKLNSAKSGLEEDKAFEPLAEIFDKAAYLVSRSAPILEQTFGEGEYTDGYFILKEAEDHVRAVSGTRRLWCDLILTDEFKLRDADEDWDDNATKLVFSMQHTRSLDRFTLGITIGSTTMRLCFCSRTLMAVDEATNFITDPELFARIFLSLAFSSRAELGWDPTIRVRGRDQKRVHCIEVNGKAYEIVEVLSDFGADVIIGRATRVFKMKIEDTEKHYVSKDVWVKGGLILID